MSRQTEIEIMSRQLESGYSARLSPRNAAAMVDYFDKLNRTDYVRAVTAIRNAAAAGEAVVTLYMERGILKAQAGEEGGY